jgi:hypothetical protein
MTAVMRAGGGRLPPTARSVATFADGPPDDYAMLGMALHFLYGATAGVVFALGGQAVGFGFGNITVAAALSLF